MTGAELRQWRQQLGLSQAGLAARLGVARETIARWETEVLTVEHPAMLRLALEQLRSDEHRGKGGR